MARRYSRAASDLNLPLIVMGAGLLGLGVLAWRSVARAQIGPQPPAPGPQPRPPTPSAPRLLGDLVQKGDVVTLGPGSLAGLFPIPANTVGVLYTVTGVTTYDMTGLVTGVVTAGAAPGTETAIGPFGPYPVPRAMTVAIRRNGQSITLPVTAASYGQQTLARMAG